MQLLIFCRFIRDLFSRDWSFFSVSLHGEVHDWYKFDDTSVEIASVVTNDELLMGRDAADLSLSKQPTIAETYGRGKKTKIQQSLSGIDMNAVSFSQWICLFSIPMAVRT